MESFAMFFVMQILSRVADFFYFSEKKTTKLMRKIAEHYCAYIIVTREK